MKKEVISLSVEKREKKGSSQSVILRKQGLVPGVLYGSGLGKAKPELIQINSLDLNKVLAVVEESTLVTIILGKKSYPTLIKDIQQNPLKAEVLSIDFFAPDLNEAVETPVALEFEGVSQSEKDGNTLIKVHQEIEVSALPGDLPEHIVVDITTLETVDDVIRVADLVFPKGVTPLLEADELIAITEAPQAEEEPELSKDELDALEKSQAENNSKKKEETE
jgi:large subunit ribosomal protein L25